MHLSRSAVILTLLVFLLASITSARAVDLEVVYSTAPGLQVGTKFKVDAEFNVPDGASVGLLRSSGNTTHIIHGPYRGTLAKYEKNSPRFWGLLFGGARQESEPPLGGTRAPVVTGKK